MGVVAKKNILYPPGSEPRLSIPYPILSYCDSHMYLFDTKIRLLTLIKFVWTFEILCLNTSVWYVRNWRIFVVIYLSLCYVLGCFNDDLTEFIVKEKLLTNITNSSSSLCWGLINFQGGATGLVYKYCLPCMLLELWSEWYYSSDCSNDHLETPPSLSLSLSLSVCLWLGLVIYNLCLQLRFDVHLQEAGRFTCVVVHNLAKFDNGFRGY